MNRTPAIPLDPLLSEENLLRNKKATRLSGFCGPDGTEKYFISL